MKKIYILIVGFSILALSGCNTKDNNDIIGEKEEPKKEVKKELPKTGTAESSAFSVLVGFLLLAASVFLYRTKKVN